MRSLIRNAVIFSYLGGIAAWVHGQTPLIIAPVRDNQPAPMQFPNGSPLTSIGVPQAVGQTVPVILTTTTVNQGAPAPAASLDIELPDNGPTPSVLDRTDPMHLMPQNGRFRLRGWLDGGYVYNTRNPGSHYNGPYSAVDRANEPMGNQAYLISEYLLPCDGSFGVGGRLDLLYGEDFFLAQSRGLEKQPNGAPHWNGEYYGFAIPQAYGEFGNNQHNVKVGHFYSIVGYESVQSPNNFFYSHAYSYQFATPFTHTGVLGTSKVTDRIQLQAGLTNGWDALNSTENSVSFIGGAKYTADSWWTSFALTTGQDPTNQAGTPGISNGYSNRTRYSFLVDARPSDRLEYVFHHWFGAQERSAIGGKEAYWYGIDQYLYYKVNDCLRVGGRFEWFRDEEGTRVGLNRATNPNNPPLAGNFYSATFGVNYNPCPNVTLRPEIRWDFYDGNTKPYNDGTRTDQLMLGMSVLMQF